MSHQTCAFEHQSKLFIINSLQTTLDFIVCLDNFLGISVFGEAGIRPM